MPNKFTPEGMALVCPATFPLSVQYSAVGAGDDPSLGRGKGPAFVFGTDPAKNLAGVFGPMQFQMTFGFNDACYLAGGGMEYDGAMAGDYLDLSIGCPASTVAPAANNTGNATLVPVSQTTSIILPAPNGGPYNVVTANPVPAYDNTPLQNPNGYWEWADADSVAAMPLPSPDSVLTPNTGSGVVVPTGIPGKGSYNLLTTAVPLNRLLTNLPMCGSHERRFTPMLKPKRILPQWTFTATMFNVGHGGLRATWYLEIGRVSTT